MQLGRDPGASRAARDGQADLAATDLAGVYEVQTGNDLTARFCVNLGAQVATQATSRPLEVGAWFAALALATLVAEAWLTTGAGSAWNEPSARRPGYA